MFDRKRIHLIGIGGVSMSGIAYILKSLNAIVTGSDIYETDITKKLINDGIIVKYGHHPEMIKDADIIVYTAAINENDPERVEAKKLHKEMHERAEFLGELSKQYKNCLCISGTHGKSTTTGMVSVIFLEANLDPTIQIGAMLSQINGNIKIGKKDYLIMEACEYVDSFLNFHPTNIIITNIDNDHLDYFKNLENIKKSFNKYVNLLPHNGLLVKNNDDDNSHNVENGYTGKIITYSINNEADYMAKNIIINELGHPTFDIYYHNEFVINIALNINGMHNIYNALAAFALCKNYINDNMIIKTGLEKYRGVGRRFEYIGTYNGCYIYDDYAHHPTEIKTALESVKSIKHNQDWAVFQAHTFSRTKEHLDAFADVLSKFDNIIIAPIYAAREINTFNINENMLVDKIKKQNKKVIYLDSFEKIAEYLKEYTHNKDLIITIGAGPINQVAKNICNNK